MKKIFWLTAMCLTLTLQLFAEHITSPNGDIVVNISTNNTGNILYTINYKNQPVITESRMGFDMEETNLYDGFTITGSKTGSFNESWNPVWGQYSEIKNHYNYIIINFKQPQTGNLMDIELRVYNDGVGFRYDLTEQEGLNYLTIREEITEFNQTGDHIAFCIPNDYDTNEFAITTKPLSQIEPDIAITGRSKGFESRA